MKNIQILFLIIFFLFPSEKLNEDIMKKNKI
jgi:hypothetical protein